MPFLHTVDRRSGARASIAVGCIVVHTSGGITFVKSGITRPSNSQYLGDSAVAGSTRHSSARGCVRGARVPIADTSGGITTFYLIVSALSCIVVRCVRVVVVVRGHVVHAASWLIPICSALHSSGGIAIARLGPLAANRYFKRRFFVHISIFGGL